MTPVDHIDEGNADKIANAASAEATNTQKPRDWARLITTHIKVAALAPFVAATLYSLLSPDRATLFTWRGFVGYIALVGCTYVFFGVFAIAGVILVSPLLYWFSKIRSARIGLVAAILVTGGAAWVIGSLSDVRAFQIAAAITAVLGAVKLERAWRTTK